MDLHTEKESHCDQADFHTCTCRSVINAQVRGLYLCYICMWYTKLCSSVCFFLKCVHIIWYHPWKSLYYATSCYILHNTATYGPILHKVLCDSFTFIKALNLTPGDSYIDGVCWRDYHHLWSSCTIKKEYKSRYVTALCGITMQNFVNKSMHLECNYSLPPSVMGSLNWLVPLTLTAATWKAYSVFRVRPSMMAHLATTDLFHCIPLPAPQVG